MKIIKYKLDLTEEQHIDIPGGAVVLDIQLQHADDIVMWVMQDDEAPVVSRTFVIVEEGVDMTPHKILSYIGSVQTHLVKNTHHFFEVTG